jgi:hypothetical protein
VESHEEDGCVLRSLIGIIRDRGETPTGRLLMLHAGCDVDALWSDLGHIVDKLQEGEYITPDATETARYRLLMADSMANDEDSSDDEMVAHWISQGVPEEVAGYYINKRAHFLRTPIPTVDDLDADED